MQYTRKEQEKFLDEELSAITDKYIQLIRNKAIALLDGGEVFVSQYIKTDENGDPAWVELRYEADYGFSLNRFKDYEKWIGVPLRVTREYLGIEDFRLFISGRPYIYHTVFNTIAAKDDHPVVM